jgi:hypothetical protein
MSFLDSEMVSHDRLTIEKSKLFRILFGFCPQVQYVTHIALSALS